jgi:serine/threonine-protein kinase HipA
MSREIQVYADWEASATAAPRPQPERLGVLRAAVVRGSEVFAFEYSPEWLAGRTALHLDPELSHFGGSQYVGTKERENFGVFLDSSPDRWGRVLMRRREAVLARRESRPARTLLESDYLLGVHDAQRLGGIRFRLEKGGPFLSHESEMSAPPWTSLRPLAHASWHVQDERKADDASQEKWLQMLMAPGSSLGGARPKAGVMDETGALWIAKFPGRSDDHDVGAWEMVVHQLATAAGLRVAEARVEKLSRRHSTFLVRRFDRVTQGSSQRRLHFASAMTMLGHSDGASHTTGVSYLELAEFIMQHGSAVARDLEELWRRIVFSILVSNTDDHLRNHGFILENTGWGLSPAYDLNPNPLGTGLSLNISDADNALDLDLARDVAPHFRVSQTRSAEVIQRAVEAVSRWRQAAEQLLIPRKSQQEMEAAFHQSRV